MENKDILLDLLVNQLVTNHLISIDPTKIGQVKQIVAKYAFYATEGPRRGPDADRKPLSIAEAHAAAAMAPQQDGPTFSEMTVHPKELERIKAEREQTADPDFPSGPTVVADAPTDPVTVHQITATEGTKPGPENIGPVTYLAPDAPAL